jgi:tetratricopeptide (TPR) repeat protein
MQEILFEDKVYQVSFEAMPDALKAALSAQDLCRYIELLQRIQMKPRAVYKEVQDFCSQHPDVPEVINMLTFAHIQNFRIAEAESLIETTYLNHPEYLFARINYADQCIRKKKLDKVTEIFPSFNLQELYPGKVIYHTSEFRGFLIMMSYYFMALKNRERALHYFVTAKELEPNHPNILYLEKKLNKVSLIKKLLGKLQSARR